MWNSHKSTSLLCSVYIGKYKNHYYSTTHDYNDYYFCYYFFTTSSIPYVSMYSRKTEKKMLPWAVFTKDSPSVILSCTMVEVWTWGIFVNTDRGEKIVKNRSRASLLTLLWTLEDRFRVWNLLRELIVFSTCILSEVGHWMWLKLWNIGE